MKYFNLNKHNRVSFFNWGRTKNVIGCIEGQFKNVVPASNVQSPKGRWPADLSIGVLCHHLVYSYTVHTAGGQLIDLAGRHVITADTDFTA